MPGNAAPSRVGKWFVLRWSIALLAGLFLQAGESEALSCAQVGLDEQVVDSSAIIFEGVAGPSRPLEALEESSVMSRNLNLLGGSVKNLRVYPFTVTQGWKAAFETQRINVLHNDYWGDTFREESVYLVVAPLRVGDLAWAPLCGHSKDPGHPLIEGDRKLLETVVGLGSHVKVSWQDRACRSDLDCARVQTHCGGCDCGTPVSRSLVESYQTRLEKVCAMIRQTDQCERSCAQHSLACERAVCVER